MRVELDLTVHRLNRGPDKIAFAAKRMFNAGWVGSDRQALQHHIDELAAVGVTPPKHIPTLLALGNHLLTHSRHIQVHGPETSGEVEWVLLWHRGEILVTVGSDHTDRKLESVSVAKSKNMCLNVIAREAWPYEEVKDHFSRLELRCTVTRGDRTSLYQEGRCDAILSPEYWIADLDRRLGGLQDGLVLFSGTIGTVRGLVVGDGYDFSLHDPVLDRTIRHGYSCEVMAGAIETF